jgi:hypothetical protein
LFEQDKEIEMITEATEAESYFARAMGLKEYAEKQVQRAENNLLDASAMILNEALVQIFNDEPKLQGLWFYVWNLPIDRSATKADLSGGRSVGIFLKWGPGEDSGEYDQIKRDLFSTMSNDLYGSYFPQWLQRKVIEIGPWGTSSPPMSTGVGCFFLREETSQGLQVAVISPRITATHVATFGSMQDFVEHIEQRIASYSNPSGGD